MPVLKWIKNQWVWSRQRGEGLTLYVPLSYAMTNIKADQRGMALADWYRQRSSLFSDDWGTVYNASGPQQTPPQSASQTPKQPPSGDLDFVVSEAPAVSSHSPAPEGGYLSGSQDFESFKIVLLAAIAKAWEDDDFCTKLQIDAATALSKIRSYELPWDLGIEIRDDTWGSWTPPDSTAKAGSGQSFWSWSSVAATQTKHQLTLYLPPAPDVDSQPLALAMYNAAGAEYPFTCCCDP